MVHRFVSLEISNLLTPNLRVRYQTVEFAKHDIHLRTLRDNQEFSDANGIAEDLGISSATWPLFGILWPSGEALARLMLSYPIEGRRILEVGCGIALSSLLLSHRLADITATDYHPEAGNFLIENTLLNKGKTIPYIRTGWGDIESALGKFDLIIGSDLLYERGHAKLLSQFINQHANEHCEIIIVDPGRGHHNTFSKLMENLGYQFSSSKPLNAELLTLPCPRGQILHYQR